VDDGGKGRVGAEHTHSTIAPPVIWPVTEAVAQPGPEAAMAPTIWYSGESGRPTRRSRRRPNYAKHPGKGRAPGLVALVYGLVGGLVGGGLVTVWHVYQSPGAVQVTVVHGSPGPALAQGSSIPEIASKALSSVVTITATGPSLSVLGNGQSSLDLGTGMIIDTRGDILTNNHVVAGSVAVSVTLNGQTQPIAASVVGTDPAQDIALIRITDPPTGLVPVVFGDSGRLEVGDAVVAVGDALGLSASSPTVTSGIVSALARTVQSQQATSSGSPASTAGATLVDMIQTDAPLNSGNSGGPLIDSAGRVVGMNTEVVSTNPDGTPAEDIGFAIPSDRLIAALSLLEKLAAVPKAMLGVEVVSNSPTLQSRYGLAVRIGAVVVAVDGGSPADNAGVRVGDVIVGFDSRAVSSSGDLQTDVEVQSAGQHVTLRLWRGGHELTLNATLEAATVAS
jgi:S1-C subfamily serine protease